MDIKESNQRSHEEGRDNGAKAYDGTYLAPGKPGRLGQDHPEGDADKVTHDPHILELYLVLALRNDQGDGIIGRHPQIGRKVEGGGKAHDHDAGQEHHKAPQEV